MEYVLCGWAPDGPTLRLDHKQFSYAGKFVMSSTGKAVAREAGKIIAAVAFNEDRTDDQTLWLRYVTVRQDRRSDGIGSRLCAAVREHVLDHGYDRVRIAVNNPYAFQALSKAGFGPTGETTGIAEQIMEAPPPKAQSYADGLTAFLDREDLSADERSFVREHRERGPPEHINPPQLRLSDGAETEAE